MKCNFERIAEGICKCSQCGFTIKINTEPSMIKRQCQKMGVIEKIASFTETIVDTIVAEEKFSSNEEIKKRLSICAGNETIAKCDHFDNGSCKLCGCHMNLKARLEQAHCPINKW